MATLTFSQQADMLHPDVWSGSVSNPTSTRFTYSNGAGNSGDYYGSFLYSSGNLSGGTVTGYDAYSSSGLSFTVRGASLSALTVKGFLDAANPTGLQQYTLNGNDTIVGSAFADTLLGWNGNDILNGGAGADTLIGGAGNDTYVVDDIGDVVTETSTLATEIDTVQSSISYTLGANVENLILTGVGNINGTGNGLANVLTGSSGNNILDGGAGADSLRGGLGDDTYIIDLKTTGTGATAVASLQDTITEVVGGGADTLQVRGSAVLTKASTLTLAANVENFDASGTGTTLLNLTGNALDNLITGNAAANILNGGVGADTLIGGAGDDTYVVDNVLDVVNEEANTDSGDLIQASISIDLGLAQYAGIENLTLIGTTAINGTGDDGANILTGNAAANTLTGGAGDDTLNGGLGADTMLGGTGNDTYVVDNILDIVNEEANADSGDLIQASISIDLGLAKYAGIENLTLTGTAALNGTGNAAANVITGNAGANILDGKGGADTLIGGLGNDTYIVADANAAIVELAAGGIDTMKLASTYAAASCTAEANVENLDASAMTIGIALVGNELANTLTGGSGNDTLDGGLGADILKGGLGNDSYIVDLKTTGTGATAVASLQDTVTEVVGGAGGIDTLQLRGSAVLTKASTLILAADLENLDASGTGATLLNLTGNALDNLITGNAADNILNGGLGADTLIGGAGNDTYFVDNTGDQISELDGEGTDLANVALALAGTFTLSNYLENATVTSIAAVNLTGNGLDNILTGNAAANTLTGGAGNDTLNGGAGADTLIGGSGNDTYVVDNILDVVNEEGNADSGDLIQASISIDLGLAKYAGIENLTLTGTAAINGTGTDAANILTGNAAANILDGKGGTDTLIGGLGNDTYIIDDVGDTITELAAGGTDTVKLAATYAAAGRTTEANVENIDASALTANIALTGNDLANILTGGSGNDTLDGGLGVDVLKGGRGNDTYLVDLKTTGTGATAVASLQDTVTENLNEGTDTLNLRAGDLGLMSASTLILGANLENIDLTDTGSNKLNVTGNALNNVITGNAADNILDGGAGNDTLIGGEGSDTLKGGLGDDTFYVDNVGDVVVETLGAGTDVVNSSVSYTLGANIENLILTGTADIDATGNALNNTITGNSGANVLSGGGGNDTLIGGAGNDIIDGGTGSNDVLNLSGSQDDYIVTYNDTTHHYKVTGLDGVDDLVNVEFLSFAGGGSPVAIGNLVSSMPAAVAAASAPQYAIDALDSGTTWTSTGSLTLTYSFMTAVPSYYATAGVAIPTGFIALDSAHKAAVRQALQGYANIINVSFSEVASGGVLQYGSNIQSSTSGYAYYPGPDATNGTSVYGDVWLNNRANTYAKLAPGEYGLKCIVHETGHTLGLKHPGNYSGAEAGPFLSTEEDTRQFSVMSYNDWTQSTYMTITGTPLGGYTATPVTIYPDTPCIDDVAALQSMYGANTGFAAGDNVYTFSDTPFFKSIWDGGGTDTIDVSGLSRHSIIDLRAGKFSSIDYVLNPDELLPTMDPAYSSWLAGLDPTYTGQNNMAICYGVTIENATGSAFDDKLIGNEVANVLNGGAGNDWLAGGAGNDVLTGGDGADRFYFNTVPDAVSNFDQISDFTAAIDKFMLDNSAFGGLAPGVLSADAFASGAGLTAATTASQRIVYDLSTGMLYYDADGHPASGPDLAAVAFAQITSGVKPTLSATDFSIYSPA